VKHTRLEGVAEALSNGERVDWGMVRRRFSGEFAADYLTHLETLSNLTTLDEVERVQDPGREPFWIRVLFTFAIAGIVLGIVGALAYRNYTWVNALRLLMVLSFAGTGVVLRRNRASVRARDLGSVFVLLAFGFSRYPLRMLADDWLPASVVGRLLWQGLAVDAWAAFFIWRFAQRFPVTVRFTTFDRIAIACATIAAAIGTALFALNVTAAFMPLPDLALSFTMAFEEGQRYSGTIFFLTLLALPVMLMRAGAAPSDERDRVRIFALAMAVGISPICIEVMLEALVPRYTAFLRGSTGAQAVMVTTVLIPLLVLPVVTGYSVLVHRLLDIRVAVGRGLRYLLARWTLMCFIATPFGCLAAHVYSRRNDSIAAVLMDGRGALLLGLVTVAGALFAGRGVLLRFIDRWFDRRGADRSAVLARAGEQLRLVRTASELVVAVDAAAGSALSAMTEVYLYDAKTQAYVPVGRGGLPLSGDSALATVLAREPSMSTLRIDEDRSIARMLPDVERRWLEGRQACVVAPIRAAGAERPAGIVVFGPRRDALGYSGEDDRFVTVLMSSAGIAFDNLRLKTEATDGPGDGDFGAVCGRCRQMADVADGARCSCGGELQPASVPRRLNGKFLVEALLGAGGMGVAYLASDLALGRRVAMKTLPAVSAEGLARLGREARTMAALSHRNLATIFGYESWRGTPILVCEYLPNGTLQQRLARGRLSSRAALALGLELLSALEYMHGHGVLHRDIKPSNIAFAADDIPKLLDFGLAGLIEAAQAMPGDGGVQHASLAGTTPGGTVAYLPPEAFRGGEPTVRFDLWALAVVLFEMIVGRHPFAAGGDTVYNISRSRFVVSAEGAPDIPAPVAAFLRDALRPGRALDSCAAFRAVMETARAAANEEVRYAG
jgi:hypothetical protein